ncbi:LysR family transcriptional regulator [uncultured Slackia sp.]|uniref:LysR family transcriptional regulator n=1 Tax=uncultured Slackia sp. TaxID=665903 RepID=UPI0026DF37BC|nr:LysR family transcriptional regulator [uncultured Slackia sp.]
MDISFLKEYIAFSRTMNYAKTAQELFMAQPTLRAHIHALESELGIALVQKKGTRLELTPTGRLLLKHARLITNQADKAIEECRDFANRSASINIGTLDYPLFEKIILDARSALAESENPCHIDITFAAGAYANIESLIAKDVDMAVFVRVRQAGQNEPEQLCLPESIQSIRIAESECRFWIDRQCPLYDAEEIHTYDVEGYTLHLGNSENMAAAGQAIQSYFDALGVKITIDTQPCSDYRDLLFVDEAASFGIVLSGTRSQDKEMLGARIFSFADLFVPCDVYALYNEKALGSCGKKFIDAFRCAAESIGDR